MMPRKGKREKASQSTPPVLRPLCMSRLNHCVMPVLGSQHSCCRSSYRRASTEGTYGGADYRELILCYITVTVTVAVTYCCFWYTGTAAASRLGSSKQDESRQSSPQSSSMASGRLHVDRQHADRQHSSTPEAPSSSSHSQMHDANRHCEAYM